MFARHSQDILTTKVWILNKHKCRMSVSQVSHEYRATLVRQLHNILAR